MNGDSRKALRTSAGREREAISSRAQGVRGELVESSQRARKELRAVDRQDDGSKRIALSRYGRIELHWVALNLIESHLVA